MSIAILPPLSTPAAPTLPATVAELLERMKDIPPSRILLDPRPGTATEEHLIEAVDGEKHLCELVDGVLVEKAMSYYESRVAIVLSHLLATYLDSHDHGILLGADAMVRMKPGRVRLPDASFFSWSQFPNRLLPRGQILGRTPDFAVEVISPSNTAGEMEQKRREYFAGLARLVWQVYPDTVRVRVYTAVETFEELGENDTLTGGAVLPGFTLSIRHWFEQAGQREE
jgi:Uma2 family endonuclease